MPGYGMGTIGAGVLAGGPVGGTLLSGTSLSGRTGVTAGTSGATGTGAGPTPGLYEIPWAEVNPEQNLMLWGGIAMVAIAAIGALVYWKFGK